MYWVGNNKNISFWGSVCSGLGKISDNRGVGIEEVYKIFSSAMGIP